MNQNYYVYILTNRINTVLYIGITACLRKRLYIHKRRLVKGFTSRYHVWKLVYVETYSNVNEAIVREKQLKNWHKEWKVNLIREKNPHFEEILLK